MKSVTSCPADSPSREVCLAPTPRNLSRGRLKRICLHEAGHAVTAYLSHIRFDGIVVGPHPDMPGCAGFVALRPPPKKLARGMLDGSAARTPGGRSRIQRELMVVLAGLATESLFFRKVDAPGASDDLYQAQRLSRLLTTDIVERNRIADLAISRLHAGLAVPPVKKAIECLADYLMHVPTMSGTAARMIIELDVENGGKGLELDWRLA